MYCWNLSQTMYIKVKQMWRLKFVLNSTSTWSVSKYFDDPRSACGWWRLRRGRRSRPDVTWHCTGTIFLSLFACSYIGAAGFSASTFRLTMNVYMASKLSFLKPDSPTQWQHAGFRAGATATFVHFDIALWLPSFSQVTTPRSGFRGGNNFSQRLPF